MTKGWKKILALGLSAIMTTSIGMTVFADNVESGSATADATITKRLRAADGLVTPTYTFKFNVEPGLEQVPTSTGTLDDTTTASPELVLADGQVWVIAFDSDDKLAVGDGANLKDSEGFYYYEKSVTNQIDVSLFKHAGIYTYIVTEVNESTTYTDVSYSKEQYEMTVYVVNTEAMDGTLKIEHVIFEKVEADGTTKTKSPAIFTNGYTKAADLEISKTVSGTYADMTKEFEYTITFENPTGVTATEFTGTKTDFQAEETSITLRPGDTFTLKHNEKIIFNLPVGTTYVLTETGSPNYKATVTVTTGKGSLGERTGGKGEATTVGGAADIFDTTEPVLVSEETSDDNSTNNNKAAWTNTYVDPPTPTGILMDNLPFIVLILVAVGGFAGYIISKRRRIGK